MIQQTWAAVSALGLAALAVGNHCCEAFVCPCLAPAGQGSPLRRLHVARSPCFNPPRGRVAMMAKGKKARAKQEVLETPVQETGSSDETTTYSVDRLRAEAATPFRKVRLFIYGAFGFSSFIGGVTAISQLAATLTGQEGALELSQALANVGVDLGVFAFSLFCLNFETKQQQGLEKAQAQLREKKGRVEKSRITDDVNTARVKQLRALAVRLPGEDGEPTTNEVPAGVLMEEANQHVAVVAGSSSFINDALLEAMVAKAEVFSGNVEILVVPVNMEAAGGGQGGGGGGGKGFSKPAYSNEGFVAQAVDVEAWGGMMQEEIDAAIEQGAEQAEEGVVLVVSRSGKIVRRGTGRPKWKVIKDDLQLAQWQ